MTASFFSFYWTVNRAPLKAQSGPYGVVTAPPGLGVDRTASKVTLLVDVSVSGFRRLCIWFGRREFFLWTD